MFTGIVEEVGMVTRLERQASRARLGVACRHVLSDAELGTSIAVDGCCLTVSKLTDDAFEADLMLDTLTTTVLGDLSVDNAVNLERPLAAGGRFAGHLVQGHVDGVGRIIRREEHPGSVLLTVASPTTVTPYLARKGSVTLQGVSLTVADTDRSDGTFRVGLIPHTCEVTTLGRLAVGDRVNLEADIVAKYLQELVNRTADEATPPHRGTSRAPVGERSWDRSGS